MYGRFEDRLKGYALEMQGYLGHVQARSPEDLSTAFEKIEQARQAGHWVALALDYELAELFEPRLPARDAAPHAPLNALVFEQAQEVALWDNQAKPELKVSLSISQQDYRDALAQVQQGLQAGDFYQINYTMPLSTQSGMAPRDLYTALASLMALPFLRRRYYEAKFWIDRAAGLAIAALGLSLVLRH